MNVFKLKIKRGDLEVSLVGVATFFAFFSNTLINEYLPILSDLQKFWKILLILTLILLFVLRHIKPSKTMMFTAIFLMWGVFSTLFNGGSVIAMISSFSSSFLIVLLLENYKNNKNKLSALMNAWKILILITALVDIYTELKYKNGLYSTVLYTNNWFLGYKTERVLYSFPMVMIATYTSLEKDGKLNLSVIVYTVIAMIGAFLSDASTASAMFVAVLIFIIIYKIVHNGKGKSLNKILNAILDYRFIIALYITITFIVVIFQRIESLSIIAEIFDKSITLSGRSRIWTKCLSTIAETPLFGKGYISGTGYVSLTGMNAGTNAHNMILQILMLGGFMALAIYMLFVIAIMKNKAGQIRDKNSYIGIFAIFIYVMFLSGITSAIFVFSPFGMLPYWLFENYEIRKQSIL